MLFDPSEHDAVAALAELVRTNPFLPERINLERTILGSDFIDETPVWTLTPETDDTRDRPNVEAVNRRVAVYLEDARARFLAGATPSDTDARLYEALAQYHLYYLYEDRLYRAVCDPPKNRKLSFYGAFKEDFKQIWAPVRSRRTLTAERLFAFVWQLRRAFHYIFRRILGTSMAAARLRAAVWESVFTRDLDRYRRVLFTQMHDIPTLITGPSGTGKELVAQAIGSARFIPFDPKTETFSEDFRSVFQPLHLAALSPTLVESELFGHEKGAFTGAQAARAGFLEGRTDAHTVFLDEIGEVEPILQVKLLRVLQTRTFHRLGDAQTRPFAGKIIAATHRDLSGRIRAGQFREDFYYRLCADHIRTPSLAEQLDPDGAELRRLVASLAERMVGAEERVALTEEVLRFVESDLGFDYAWPGNMRELEQCLRSVLVRGQYVPAITPPPAEGFQRLWADARAASLTADEVLTRYCTWMYFHVGSYEGAARRLQLDRRTVKRHVDPTWLEALREEV